MQCPGWGAGKGAAARVRNGGPAAGRSVLREKDCIYSNNNNITPWLPPPRGRFRSPEKDRFLLTSEGLFA